MMGRDLGDLAGQGGRADVVVPGEHLQVRVAGHGRQLHDIRQFFGQPGSGDMAQVVEVKIVEEPRIRSDTGVPAFHLIGFPGTLHCPSER